MGRWSAGHRKTAVFGWLAFVLAAVAIGNAVGTKNISMQDVNVGQSRKADQMLGKGFPQADPQTESVLVQSSTRTVNDPAFRATINDVAAAVKGNPAIKNLKSPTRPEEP
jgi:RND superfamily putative drug exporter